VSFREEEKKRRKKTLRQVEEKSSKKGAEVQRKKGISPLPIHVWRGKKKRGVGGLLNEAREAGIVNSVEKRKGRGRQVVFLRGKRRKGDTQDRASRGTKIKRRGRKKNSRLRMP